MKPYILEFRGGMQVVISPPDEKTRLKALIILLVMCLSFYPVAELTRVIWTISYIYDPSRLAIWIAETVFMWLMYLLIIPVMIYLRR